MNTTYELSEPGVTSAPADDLGDVTGLPHWGTTRDEPVMAVSETSEREEVLALLVQRIGELPTATKKILALHYQENFPLSEIAACFNLSERQTREILSQTLGLLRRSFVERIGPEFGV